MELTVNYLEASMVNLRGGLTKAQNLHVCGHMSMAADLNLGSVQKPGLLPQSGSLSMHGLRAGIFLIHPGSPEVNVKHCFQS